MLKNILITGMPGSGKSTILEKVITQYPKKVGFITREIRKGKDREGFEIATHAGDKVLLAHISFNTSQKVSKYFVNIPHLESLLPKVSNFQPDDLLYLDEIGQMQLFSDCFKQLFLTYLDSDNIVLCTISKIYADAFTTSLKKRNDVLLIEITDENRASQLEFISQLITKILKARSYILEKERFTIKENKAEMRSTHALRTLSRIHNRWTCDCDFFKKHSLCSHALALTELSK